MENMISADLINRLEKRKSNLPPYLKAAYHVGMVPPPASSTRSKAGRGKGANNGGKQTLKPKSKGKASGSSALTTRYKDESDDDFESREICDLMPDEVCESVKDNENRINYLQENMEVALYFILSVLPIQWTMAIANEIRAVESEDHIMLKNFIQQALDRKTSNQGNDKISNDSVVNKGMEGVAEASQAQPELITGTGGDATGTNQATQGPVGYAAVAAANLPRNINEIIQQTVNRVTDERFDDIYRKKILL